MRIDKPLTTARLILDTLDPDRLDPVYIGWLNDPQVNRFLELRFHRHDADSVRRFVSEMNASADNLMLGIFLKDGRRHIGNIKLGPIVVPHRRADIGLMIGDQACWGKGYAAEAIGAISNHAFNALGLYRVTAGCYADNIGSYKAFLKNGFREDGRFKDHYRLGDGWQDHIALYKLAERDD